MESVEREIRSGTETGKDVNDLLRAIGVLLRLCEGRLAQHAMSGTTQPAGSHRALVRDISALHAVSGALGEVAVGLANSARDSLNECRARVSAEPSAATTADMLRSACDKTLNALDTALLAITTVRNESIKQREVLLETALRKDLSPELRGEIEQLIHRIGDQSRGAPGAAQREA